MNELEYIGTNDSGNSLFFFPCNGHMFTFEVVSPDAIRIHAVSTCQGVEREFDEFSSFEQLPSSVRSAISTSPYRMQSTVTEAIEAM